MANDVIYHHSGETGAPVLNNATGAMDALLNACLVTGFNTQTPTSIVVSGGVATVTKSGHGFMDKAVVLVSGASPAGLNGNQLITVTGSGEFTFPTTAANGTASGTISIKKAPLGWTRPANSGNVSIYQRAGSSPICLRVNDSAANGASSIYTVVRMVWDWTDVNTFTNSAPSVAQASVGHYWTRGADNTSAKEWVLIGDGRTFYIFIDSAAWPKSGAGTISGIYGFGDLESYKQGDAYASCLWAGGGGEATMTARGYALSAGPAGNTNGFTIARGFSGTGTPVGGWMVGSANAGGGIGRAGPAYPSPVENGMALRAPVLVQENSQAFNYPVRGALRGAAEPLSAGDVTLNRTIFDAVFGSSRRWMLMYFHNQNSAQASLAFDLTGPWA
jgi:hypothetical protein